MTSPKTTGPKKTWHVGTLTYTIGSLFILLGWMIWGDFAWQLKDRSVMPVIQVILKKFEASDFFTGFLLATVPAAVMMTVGPVVSYYSDRHRGRWGRRMPFLIAATPVVVIPMVAMAFSPWLGQRLHELLGASSPGVNFCNLIIVGISWGIFEIGTVTAQYLFNALVNDVVPKELLGRFFGVFRAVSLLAGIIFSHYVLGYADSYFAAIFIGMGVVYAVGFTMMCLKVKEGSYPPPPAPKREDRPQAVSTFLTYFRETYSKPFYLLAGIVIAATGVGTGLGLVFMPVNLFSVAYAKSIGMPLTSYGQYYAIAFTISLCLAPFLGILADKFHPLRLGILSMFLYLVTAVWGFFFAKTPDTFGIAFAAHVVLSGTYFTTTASLAQRIYPQDRFAQFFSAFNIIGSAAYMLMPLCLGAVLDWTGRDYALTFAWGAVSAALFLVAMVVVYIQFMRLGGPKGYTPPAV